MEFEFDGGKSRANKQKHGLDFIEAQALWDDQDLLEIPAKTTDEARFLVVGKIDGKYWSGIITYRGKKNKDYICSSLKGRGGGVV